MDGALVGKCGCKLEGPGDDSLCPIVVFTVLLLKLGLSPAIFLLNQLKFLKKVANQYLTKEYSHLH